MSRELFTPARFAELNGGSFDAALRYYNRDLDLNLEGGAILLVIFGPITFGISAGFELWVVHR